MRIALSDTSLGSQPGHRSLQIACLISLVSDGVTWTYCGPIRGCDDEPQWRHWLPQGVVEDRQSSVDFRPTPHTLKSCLPQQRELRRRGRDTAESAPHLHRTVLRQRPHDCGPEQPEWWRRSRLGRISRCAARRASPRASARAAQDTIEPVAPMLMPENAARAGCARLDRLAEGIVASRSNVKRNSASKTAPVGTM